MVYVNKKDYNLVGFQRSTNPKKKYDAILQHKVKHNILFIPFGARGMSQFRDSTPNKLYSHLDNNDEKRRTNFLSRFDHLLKQDKGDFYSPIYFSSQFLW